MSDDLMNFDLPVERSSIIKVLGIGGGGNNAVNHMYNHGIRDVNFVVCNTDAQALDLTEGRGAGSMPETGRRSAEENLEQVMDALSGNTRMVFITTGMGGGTGTGATPVIARACKAAGLLTIAVVTIPFRSEGKIRIKNAVEGINSLKDHVDSLLVINNEKLREIYGDQGVSSAFAKADDVLTTAVKGIAEIITVAGYINVDFADVETVMKDSGVAVMGNGSASGEERAINAIQEALTSPLLNSSDITGARSILLNITSGTGANELTMDELGEITDYIYDAASDEALIIRGISRDESLGDSISVTVIATGFAPSSILKPYQTETKKERVTLDSTARRDEPVARVSGEPEVIEVKKRKKVLFDTEEDKLQQKLEFEVISSGSEKNDGERDQGTLRKLKHMQNMIKKEGFSEKVLQDNIDELEDVPAFVRRNIKLLKPAESEKQEISRFTLTSDDDDQITLSDDNAYLNNNVD
jgi:cell division protein FtsZ